MLKQRLDHTGERISLTGTKTSLIKRVKETDKDYLSVFYKSRVSENNPFWQILQKSYRNDEESENIKAN